MKRFTETEKWRDPWFFDLDPRNKILWLWLCDRCDNVGVIDIHWKLASSDTGFDLKEEDMHTLGGRVSKLENGKWIIEKFIPFQIGELTSNPKNRVHQNYVSLLKKHGLLDTLYPTLCDSLYNRVDPTPKDKDKDKDKEEGRGEKPKKAIFVKPTLSECSEYSLSLGMPTSEGERFFNNQESKGWMIGKSPMKCWKAALRTWRTNWSEGRFSSSQLPNRPATAKIKVLKSINELDSEASKEQGAA